ncbi:SDR family NAD(P)-dependent oxidoreductase [Thiocapsa rosea]|uniref:Short subunit dehydrogenase n=1 Tax=Thiocapsa rosea TaxID=69360 RepID=A0A495VGH9_9GAMM|nr:SDR family NAD(P)-dependent oxidoreductase [Thiocapsa rosea]RKT46948.1 short subunit dehydrogenase [Thiocapsa rosea]
MSVPVCVIVGTGPGNGAAFARQFSRAGYLVALLARSRDVLDTLVAEIAGTRAYVYDAADPNDAVRVFDEIRRAWSRLQCRLVRTAFRPNRAPTSNRRSRTQERRTNLCANPSRRQKRRTVDRVNR